MAKSLPVLQGPQEKQFSACPGRALCPGCPLFAENGGPCSGCTDSYRERCLQGNCYSGCNSCGGGVHAVVVAACGRSPLRDEWAKIILPPLKPYSPAPVSIQTPLIPVIYGQRDARRIPELFPRIDAWAVPVHKAMSVQGRFRSADMKDYLGLSGNQKLILSTAGPDDFMEMLWEKGETLDYRGHGFDYWFPAHFSVYDNDSKFYQFFNARRQQIHARKVKSQFVWFRLGEHIPLGWIEPIRKCPSVLISCQQMYSRFNRELLRREIEIADRSFAHSTRFFLLGAGYGAPVRPGRVVHEIHSYWLVRAMKGYDVKGVPRPGLSRRHLLRKNLKDLYREVAGRRSPQLKHCEERG
jgi:hypothetical protein